MKPVYAILVAALLLVAPTGALALPVVPEPTKTMPVFPTKPTITVPKPTVTIPEPTRIITVPRPTRTITIPKPKPTRTVTVPEPTRTVTVPRPTITIPRPTITIIKPTITITRPTVTTIRPTITITRPEPIRGNYTVILHYAFRHGGYRYAGYSEDDRTVTFTFAIFGRFYPMVIQHGAVTAVINEPPRKVVVKIVEGKRAVEVPAVLGFVVGNKYHYYFGGPLFLYMHRERFLYRYLMPS
ncbi:hypothetical protein [Pyrococcus kukulkanii]|uniref:Uncharacterized protein n=1 Tax=Pyrococcus kukulkanii TaxID=1609559 RepID=A0ABV4T615_9EURY